MKGKQIILLVFIGLLFLVSVNTFYSVHETNKLLFFNLEDQLGAPITQAGLKLKFHLFSKFNF